MIVTGTVVAGTSMARQSCRKTRMTISTRIGGFDQRLIDFVDRLLHEERRVEGNGVDDALREFLRKRLHLRRHFAARR